MFDGISIGSLLWRFRRLALGERTPSFQFECRRCGHSASQPRRHCPECGSAEMARYDL